jgi:methyltransferase-like protein/2-polyprenyl-3-methyl-5-hydroxy-6-metoxy-1,4-benzoquinol methylase
MTTLEKNKQKVAAKADASTNAKTSTNAKANTKTDSKNQTNHSLDIENTMQLNTQTTSADMSTLNKAIEQSYDEIPYESNAFADSSPQHLASVSQLFGLEAANPATARVLELGCSMGGNLIPHAYANPNGTYLGIDLSGSQIDVANKTIENMGLKNIKFEQLDILNLNFKEIGEFDYIIAHGVYSWVPEEVKSAIFNLCKECLSPNGLAFISYNTYPGWKVKEIARDAMLFRSENQETAVKRLAHGRGMINFLEEYTAKDSLMQQIIKSEANTIRGAASYYLSHEYLESINEPCYFRDFVKKAKEHDLRYLAESEPSTMFVSNLGNDIAQALLNEANGDQITLEQYMDFVKNRQFRQTILTHQKNAEKIRYRIRAEDLKTFEFMGVFAAQNIEYDQLATTFDNGLGAKIAVSQPFEKAALQFINQAFPSTVGFGEILEGAQKIINSKLPVHADILASLIEQLLIRGFVRFNLSKVQATNTISDKPTVSELTRFMLANRQNASVTNLHHQTVKLNLVQQHIVPILDGKHTKEQIFAHLLEQAMKNVLQFNRHGVILTEAKDIEAAAKDHLDNALLLCAKQALLIA